MPRLLEKYIYHTYTDASDNRVATSTSCSDGPKVLEEMQMTALTLLMTTNKSSHMFHLINHYILSAME